MMLSRAGIGRFARFVIVGGASTLVYGVVTAMLIAHADMQPVVGSALGYLASIPFNYVFQRVFAFNSKNPPGAEFMRYMIVHASNLALSTLSMYAITEWMNADYRIGIVTTMVLVPVIVFVLLDRWVFNARNDRYTRHANRKRPI